MSFMDTLKDKLGMSKSRSNDITRQHGDDADQGMDRGGRQDDPMDPGTQKAQDPMDEGHDKGDGPA
ncbi:hypothetical protein GA0115240_16516 [Streptomyces sp. DvalAA-14]|uniref:hypothetical protein n=1 Tax=unclassified Streptomyces TaxID=2593676 RepID=UPI00081B38E8|nr:MULTISPECIES: hypothetical protein [unclassified Streptomyces]MYS24521.1 antitoxin [Streptomyces sp. SID4948]SCE46840.1 hypothetical protein GA0115240_16516 [Streptomyces sp. DvalAA-14]